MLDGVPGGDPLTFSIAVVAAVSAGVLVYQDADRHGHYHALSAGAAVAIAALVGFAVANLVGLVVATGYVLLLYLLSYPKTPGVDGDPKRRTPDRPDGTPQGDAGENITGADDVVSVIRVEIAGHETLREMARQYDDVPDDAPAPKLRERLRVKALSNVIEATETDDGFSLGDWAETDENADGLADWHGTDDADEESPAASAAAWNAEPAEREDGGRDDADEDPFTWAEVETSSDVRASAGASDAGS